MEHGSTCFPGPAVECRSGETTERNEEVTGTLVRPKTAVRARHRETVQLWQNRPSCAPSNGRITISWFFMRTPQKNHAKRAGIIIPGKTARSRRSSDFNSVRRSCDPAFYCFILGDHRGQPGRKSARSMVPSVEGRDQPQSRMFGKTGGTPIRPSADECEVSLGYRSPHSEARGRRGPQRLNKPPLLRWRVIFVSGQSATDLHGGVLQRVRGPLACERPCRLARDDCFKGLDLRGSPLVLFWSSLLSIRGAAHGCCGNRTLHHRPARRHRRPVCMRICYLRGEFDAACYVLLLRKNTCEHNNVNCC